MEIVPERVLVILDEAYFEYAEHIENYPDSTTDTRVGIKNNVTSVPKKLITDPEWD